MRGGPHGDAAAPRRAPPDPPYAARPSTARHRWEERGRAAIAALTSIADHEERLLLATGRYVGEGFDDARIDTLFLALPVSWKGTLIQYAGRLHSGESEVRIYDYVDRAVPVLMK